MAAPSSVLPFHAKVRVGVVQRFFGRVQSGLIQHLPTPIQQEGWHKSRRKWVLNSIQMKSRSVMVYFVVNFDTALQSGAGVLIIAHLSISFTAIFICVFIFCFAVYLRAVGGEVGATSTLAPKIGPLGLVSVNFASHSRLLSPSLGLE